jgi:hypothetical protein
MRHAGRRRGVKLDPAIANRRIPSGSGLAPNSIADEPPGISPGGFPSGGSNRPSCVLSGRNHDHRAILLQVPADHAVGGGTRRPICFVAVAAQRGIGRHERKWWSAALTPRTKRFIASVRVSCSTRRPQAIEYPFDLSKLLMSLSMSVVEVDSTAMGQKPNGSERSKYLPRAHDDSADRRRLLVAALVVAANALR